MHNKNYETNPRNMPRKREDAVSGVRSSASNAKKVGLNPPPNEPNVGQAFPVYGNCETALVNKTEFFQSFRGLRLVIVRDGRPLTPVLDQYSIRRVAEGKRLL